MIWVTPSANTDVLVGSEQLTERMPTLSVAVGAVQVTRAVLASSVVFADMFELHVMTTDACWSETCVDNVQDGQLSEGE